MTTGTLRQLLSESRGPKPGCQGNPRTHPKLTRGEKKEEKINKNEGRRKALREGVEERGIVGVTSLRTAPKAPPSAPGPRPQALCACAEKGGSVVVAVTTASGPRLGIGSEAVTPGPAWPLHAAKGAALRPAAGDPLGECPGRDSSGLPAAGKPLLFLPEGVCIDQG